MINRSIVTHAQAYEGMADVQRVSGRHFVLKLLMRTRRHKY